MIRSMTGFGEASLEVDGVHFSVEIRSLNNKFFKASLRLPEDFQRLEPQLDSRLRRRLFRGSITLTLRCSDTTAMAAHEINTAALQAYLDQLDELPHDEGRPINVDISSLLLLPGILQPPSNMDVRLESLGEQLLVLIDEACDKLISMRTKEGAMLLADLHIHRKQIESRLEKIAARAPLVIDEYQQRLFQRVESMLEDAGAPVNEVDLIREVAIYAERSDISEEISRLSGHLEQFRELVDDGERIDPVGRTLDFLAQEMLREANTIASKSNDSEISRDIVEIKGAIDRIKEQVQNVE